MHSIITDNCAAMINSIKLVLYTIKHSYVSLKMMLVSFNIS